MSSRFSSLSRLGSIACQRSYLAAFDRLLEASNTESHSSRPFIYGESSSRPVQLALAGLGSEDGDSRTLLLSACLVRSLLTNRDVAAHTPIMLIQFLPFVVASLLAVGEDKPVLRFLPTRHPDDCLGNWMIDAGASQLSDNEQLLIPLTIHRLRERMLLFEYNVPQPWVWEVEAPSCDEVHETYLRQAPRRPATGDYEKVEMELLKFMEGLDSLETYRHTFQGVDQNGLKRVIVEKQLHMFSESRKLSVLAHNTN